MGEGGALSAPRWSQGVSPLGQPRVGCLLRTGADCVRPPPGESADAGAGHRLALRPPEFALAAGELRARPRLSPRSGSPVSEARRSAATWLDVGLPLPLSLDDRVLAGGARVWTACPRHRRDARGF